MKLLYSLGIQLPQNGCNLPKRQLKIYNLQEFFNQHVFGLICKSAKQFFLPLPKTLVIREAKSSGCGGTLVCGCSVVSVCGYGAPWVVSEGGGLNGFIGVIIISLSPVRTPWSLPGWSTSWNEKVTVSTAEKSSPVLCRLAPSYFPSIHFRFGNASKRKRNVLITRNVQFRSITVIGLVKNL